MSDVDLKLPPFPGTYLAPEAEVVISQVDERTIRLEVVTNHFVRFTHRGREIHLKGSEDPGARDHLDVSVAGPPVVTGTL